MTTVSTLEGDAARLCAAVLTGTIGRDVSINFGTQDLTAQGKQHTESYIIVYVYGGPDVTKSCKVNKSPTIKCTLQAAYRTILEACPLIIIIVQNYRGTVGKFNFLY